MANVVIGGVHVVKVTSDQQVESLWVAVASHSDAVAAVQKVLPSGWLAISVTGRNLTQREIVDMKLRPGDVREIAS